MQSILNHQTSFGLPLCLSGITHPLTLSQEMADHERRREAMKRQKSQAREGLQANQGVGVERNHEGESEVDGDLACIVHDLSYMCLASTAKAA